MNGNDRPIAVTGALAYDQIARCDVPMAGNHGTRRNVKLMDLNEAFGGSAANIAYGLATLGETTQLISYAGALDFADYRAHLERVRLPLDTIRVLPDQRCARAIIITDPSGEQFTAFYPAGPSTSVEYREDLGKATARHPPGAWIVAPDAPSRMALAAAMATTSGVPKEWRLWIPGQYSEQLSASEILAIAAVAGAIVVNEAEHDCLERTAPGYSDACFAVVTAGGDNVQVLFPERDSLPPGGEPGGAAQKTGKGRGAVPNSRRSSRRQTDCVDVPAVSARPGMDPTGCGDSFVAGLVAARRRGADWTQSARHGVANAQACLMSRGSQNYRAVTA